MTSIRRGAASTAEIEGVLDVLRSGRLEASDGRLGVEFVQRFAQRHARSTGSSWRTAPSGFAALRALGVRPDDEVIVPAYTFIATAAAVLLAGAMPVFADVDPEPLLLHPQPVRAATTDRTSAVIPVHLSSAAADVDAVRDALPAGAPIDVIEDAAQAHATAWRGRSVRSLGDLSCVSSSPART